MMLVTRFSNTYIEVHVTNTSGRCDGPRASKPWPVLEPTVAVRARAILGRAPDCPSTESTG